MNYVFKKNDYEIVDVRTEVKYNHILREKEKMLYIYLKNRKYPMLVDISSDECKGKDLFKLAKEFVKNYCNKFGKIPDFY